MNKTVVPKANLNQLNEKAPVGNETTKNSTINGTTLVITTTAKSIGNVVTTTPSPEINSVMVGETATVSGSITTKVGKTTRPETTKIAATTTDGTTVTRSGTSTTAHSGQIFTDGIKSDLTKSHESNFIEVENNFCKF